MKTVKSLIYVIFVLFSSPYLLANEPNLIHYWDFNEVTGNNAKDSVGDSNGILNNMEESAWIEGKADGALLFDGIDDDVNCGQTDIVEYGGANGALTLTAWIKPVDTGTYNCVTTNFGGINYLSAGDPNNHLCAMVRDVQNNENYLSLSSSTIDSNSWSHIVFILEGGVGYKIYINGKLDSEVLNTNLGLYQYGSRGYIGQGFDSESYFEGGLDDIRIFNRVLSAQEIQAIYQEGAYSSYGMRIESVQGDSNEITIITTGATYVLTSNGMDMYRRIDPHTNDYDSSNEGKGRKVSQLTFYPGIGSLTAGLCLEKTAIIESEKATFDFRSDSFFFITAKQSINIQHENLISNPQWNAPLEPNERDLDRMWTDGYGGSLLARLSEDTKGTVVLEDVNSTKVAIDTGEMTGHMVYPAKKFDFEGLYGLTSRPLVQWVNPTSISAFLSDPTKMDLDANKGFGVYLAWNSIYTNSHVPKLLSSGVMGYEITNPQTVKNFIALAHDKGFKVIAYFFTPNYPYWGNQDIAVTLNWMNGFQKEYGFDGWYFDNANTSDDLMNDYNFIRKVRTDLSDSGIIYHHNSIDVWGNDLVYGTYSGLRSVMIDTYVNYIMPGETGDMAIVSAPNDFYLRYYTSGYGMSQAYADHVLRSYGQAPMSEEEKNRTLAENLNGVVRNSTNCWDSFKPFFDRRRAEYNNSESKPFNPDVNWPIDSETGWFRTPTNINCQVDDCNATITWVTDINSTSSVTYTCNGIWWKAYNNVPDGGTVSNANLVKNHSITITGLKLNTLYAYKIRSTTGKLSKTGTVSICAWIKPTNTTKYNMISRYFGGVHYFSAGSSSSPNKLYAMVRDVVNNVNYWPISNGIIYPNVWTHVACILEGRKGFRFYINGLLDREILNSNLGLYDYSPYGAVGQGDSASAFSGCIDDVQIFNKALTDSEVSAIYNETSFDEDPNLIHRWDFNDESGTIAIDKVRTNYGILRNMNLATSWVTGEIDGALNFDGVDDYVDCGYTDIAKYGGPEKVTWGSMGTFHTN